MRIDKRSTLGRLTRAVRHALRPPDYRSLQKRVEALERNDRRLLMARHPAMVDADDPRAALCAAEYRAHSQNGEDGVLLYVFSKIGSANRRLVEFGIGDGSECCCANLVLNFGWTGLMMDCEAENVAAAKRFYRERHGVPPERLTLARELVTAENIDELLARHGVQGEIDLLSIDIDGNDYWVWKAIRSVRPRVVVVEYNASLGPTDLRITPYDPGFDRFRAHQRGWHHGASLAAFARLGDSLGYRLVGCESAGVNAFFARNELAEGRLPALTPEQAFYPAAHRLARASQREQLESLAGAEFVTD